MPVTLDYAPGYAAIVNAYQDKQIARQARLVAYDSSPTEIESLVIDGAVPLFFQITDEGVAITGSETLTVRFPYAFKVTEILATLDTAPVGTPMTLDVDVNGVAMFTGSSITIDVAETTSATAAPHGAFAVSTIPANGKVEFVMDEIGTGATGLQVWIYGYPV